MDIMDIPGAMSENRRAAQQHMLAGMNMTQAVLSMSYDDPRAGIPRWAGNASCSGTCSSPHQMLDEIFLPSMHQPSNEYGVDMLNFDPTGDAASVGQETFSGYAMMGSQVGDASGAMYESYHQATGTLEAISTNPSSSIYRQSYSTSGSRLQQPERMASPGSHMAYSSQNLASNVMLPFQDTVSQESYSATLQSFGSQWKPAHQTVVTGPTSKRMVAGPPSAMDNFSYPRNSCSSLGESVAERESPGECSDSDNDPSMQVSADDETVGVETSSRIKQNPKRRRLEDGNNRKRRKCSNFALIWKCTLSDGGDGDGSRKCGQTFTLQKDLLRHQRQSLAHRDECENMFFCEDERCSSYGRRYTREDNYNRHVETKHAHFA